MSEGLKDLKFIFMCLKYLKMKVDLPMLILIDNIGAIEMLDLKTGKCHTKHVDTRYHWICEFIDDDIVTVKYVKSENNVSDICTKNLPSKLFEKHSNKLVSDVGLFTRCNTRQMGKGEPNPVERRKKRDRLDKYRLPLGRLETLNTFWNFKITQWVPNMYRMDRLKKIPLQKSPYKRFHDRTGKLIYPSNLKKHVLMRYRNSSGKMIGIYNTDERYHVDKVYDNYNIKEDLQMMLKTVEDVRVVIGYVCWSGVVG